MFWTIVALLAVAALACIYVGSLLNAPYPHPFWDRGNTAPSRADVPPPSGTVRRALIGGTVIVAPASLLAAFMGAPEVLALAVILVAGGTLAVWALAR